MGSYAGIDKYHEQLEAYVRELGLADVIFTGQIKFDEILAYYHLADVFLCMSEHEASVCRSWSLCILMFRWWQEIPLQLRGPGGERLAAS